MMHIPFVVILGGLLFLLAGCATTTPQEPQIKRISAEELERIMPKPIPNLTLDELVALSKTTPPEVIIEKIKASNSRYDLTPTQVVDLSKQGVDSKVLDYIHSAREQALRDGFADEINKREKEKQVEKAQLRRQYQYNSQRYYDPFWGYGGYGPYWHTRPYYGPGAGFNYRFGW